MERRDFLKGIGTAGVALPLVSGLGAARAFAQSPSVNSPFARPGIGQADDRVLVIIRLFGGNDGLNTVVPYTDDNYYLARRRDAQHDLSLPPEQVVKLSDSATLGLHPILLPLLPIYREGKLAIIQNVGYPDQDMSHFRSTDIWLSATDPDIYDDSGWLGRYLEQRHPDYPGVLPPAPYAIEVGTLIGRALLGRHNTMGFTLADTSFVPGAPEPTLMLNRRESVEEACIRENIRQSNVFLSAIIAAGERQPRNAVGYADNQLSRDLASVARLIAAGLGTQIYVVNTGIYDFHENQLPDHGRLLGELGSGMASFQRDIEALGLEDRTTLMTVSEFGRRVTPSGTGTDHGAASMLFVMGKEVQGGVIGTDPDISDLEGPGNLRWKYDFRQVYSSVLSQWFRAGDEDVIPSLYRKFAPIPIFRGAMNHPILSGLPSQTLRLGQPIPNPVRDVATIPVSGIPTDATADFTLFTPEGREVMRRTVTSFQKTILVDATGLSAGNYLYALVVGDRRIVRKMTVLR